MPFDFDDDLQRVDLDAVWGFLSEHAYWQRWRSRWDVERQIAGAWREVGCYDEPYRSRPSRPANPRRQGQTAARDRGRARDVGYEKIQGTRPQTLAYALTTPRSVSSHGSRRSSTSGPIPACPGLHLAGPTADQRDAVLADSLRGVLSPPLRETFHPLRHPPHTLHNTTGIAVFAADLARPLRSPLERDNHIVHRSKFDRGGHLAALEQPEPFVQDVQTFFRRFGTRSH
jgi:pimeloyl-ACP methyl ester carboxylesterase